LDTLVELYRFRDLLYLMTLRDIRIKYKQSVLGLLWAILMPSVIVLAGVLVKLVLARVSHLPLNLSDITSVCVRSVPWAFLVASIRFGTNSLISNPNLVMKIYFPKLIFPISAILSQLFDLLIASCPMAVLFITLRVPISPGANWLWMPLLVASLVSLAAGLATLLSAASLFFRDVKYLVEVLLTFAIFFTPVFFDVAVFGEWRTLLLLNPVAPLLEGISAAFTGTAGVQPAWYLYAMGLSVAILVGSVVIFRKLEPSFAECI